MEVMGGHVVQAAGEAEIRAWTEGGGHLQSGGGAVSRKYWAFNRLTVCEWTIIHQHSLCPFLSNVFPFLFFDAKCHIGFWQVLRRHDVE